MWLVGIRLRGRQKLRQLREPWRRWEHTRAPYGTEVTVVEVPRGGALQSRPAPFACGPPMIIWNGNLERSARYVTYTIVRWICRPEGSCMGRIRCTMAMPVMTMDPLPMPPTVIKPGGRGTCARKVGEPMLKSWLWVKLKGDPVSMRATLAIVEKGSRAMTSRSPAVSAPGAFMSTGASVPISSNREFRP